MTDRTYDHAAPSVSSGNHPLLSLRDLCVRFDTDEGCVRAVDHVSFDVLPGETLGLVGESGCGKSVTALSIPRLVPHPPGLIDGGSILFRDQDLLRWPMERMRRIRGAAIGMIFQEPMTALSPLRRIGSQLMETLLLHRKTSRQAARDQSVAWLGKVGLPDPAGSMQAYPFQLSGGMRQRVMIAMALMLDPALVIADEPTTAVDVTLQAQIFDLLRSMRQRETALLLITHDMGVISEMCSRVAVMYASEIVEEAPVRKLFANPLHPYTEALLASVPSLQGPRSRLPAIPGQVPSALAYPTGCRFFDRCPYAFETCRNHPAMEILKDRKVRCWLGRQRLSASPVAQNAAREDGTQRRNPRRTCPAAF